MTRRPPNSGEPPVVCVSCNPTGAPPAGNAQFIRSVTAGAGSGPVRAMSENGHMSSSTRPTSSCNTAENHTLDVYEWHEGQISLIGSPNDPFPTYFLGYSPYYLPDGERVEAGNVFIGTHARLLTEQTNTVGNIYDARACEPESPCIKPPAGETAQCEGGSCQHPPAAPPDPTQTLLAPPAPLTLAPVTTKVTKKTVKCKKGLVKKKVKQKEQCVRKAKPKKAKKSNHGRTGR